MQVEYALEQWSLSEGPPTAEAGRGDSRRANEGEEELSVDDSLELKTGE